LINLNFGDVFKHLASFLSRNWQTIGLIVVISLFFLTKNDYGALKKSMNAMASSYEEQIVALQALHEEELVKREEAIANYERELAELTEKYKESLESLKVSKEEDVEEYIRDFELQPSKLAQELEDQFGIEYVE
jgi:F0F1-type ATP synthase membrane subunit b/b'